MYLGRDELGKIKMYYLGCLAISAILGVVVGYFFNLMIIITLTIIFVGYIAWGEIKSRNQYRGSAAIGMWLIYLIFIVFTIAMWATAIPVNFDLSLDWLYSLFFWIEKSILR